MPALAFDSMILFVIVLAIKLVLLNWLRSCSCHDPVGFFEGHSGSSVITENSSPWWPGREA